MIPVTCVAVPPGDSRVVAACEVGFAAYDRRECSRGIVAICPSGAECQNVEIIENFAVVKVLLARFTISWSEIDI